MEPYVVIHPKNVLSLFSGIAGLDKSVGLVFPRSRTVCYVEREAFAASVLVARMEDKAVDDAPIWSDITTFDAKEWNGVVDTVAFGFPCTDISVAGKQEGISQGTRSGLFFEACRIIRDIPSVRYLFIENVTGLLANRFMSVVLKELSEMGFDAEWGMFSAKDVGSTHLRKRVFILAHATQV
jgi:DNA (cytosine-5)-methyltransferase 1